MKISEEQNKTAGFFVELISSSIGKDRGVHSETAIAVAARLAGSLLFRSFNFEIEKMPPGSTLLSSEANEKGPQLVNLLGFMLGSYNIQLDQSKIGKNYGEDPELSFIDTMNLLQNEVIKISKDNGLSFEAASHSMALSAAFIVRECAKNIGVEVAFNVAMLGFIEGAKTVPPPLIKEQFKINYKKPWYKFWL